MHISYDNTLFIHAITQLYIIPVPNLHSLSVAHDYVIRYLTLLVYNIFIYDNCFVSSFVHKYLWL